jgi:hypothetical protein
MGDQSFRGTALFALFSELHRKGLGDAMLRNFGWLGCAAYQELVTAEGGLECLDGHE